MRRPRFSIRSLMIAVLASAMVFWLIGAIWMTELGVAILLFVLLFVIVGGALLLMSVILLAIEAMLVRVFLNIRGRMARRGLSRSPDDGMSDINDPSFPRKPNREGNERRLDADPATDLG